MKIVLLQFSLFQLVSSHEFLVPGYEGEEKVFFPSLLGLFPSTLPPTVPPLLSFLSVFFRREPFRHRDAFFSFFPPMEMFFHLFPHRGRSFSYASFRIFYAYHMGKWTPLSLKAFWVPFCSRTFSPLVGDSLFLFTERWHFLGPAKREKILFLFLIIKLEPSLLFPLVALCQTPFSFFSTTSFFSSPEEESISRAPPPFPPRN